MEGSLEHLQIQPSNIISTGVVSFKNGNPVLQFIIAEQDKYLIGNSLRLTGNIQFFEGATPAVPTTEDINIDPKLGIYSVISELNIKSQRSKQTIEHIRHYGRFLATYLPYLSSQQEAMSYQNELSGAIPNIAVCNDGLLFNENGVSATNRTTLGSSFALHLPSGLLNGRQPIPLSANGWGTGGLLLEITLQNDSQVLFGTSLVDPFYQLSNLNLICEVVNPSIENLNALNARSSGALEYNSISSFYTSVNSTNAIVNFNLGLSKVLGVFFNTIPSDKLNNISYNGNMCLPFTNATGDVANLNQLIFTRNGVKYPLQYNVDTNINTRFIAANTEYYPADPQVVRNVLDSFMPYSDIKKTQVSPMTFSRQSSIVTGGTDDNYPDGGSMFAVGVSFDNISNQGIDFSAASLGMQMEIGLDSDNPQTIFLFVHHKNTLVFNKNGLQVIA